MKKTLSSVVLTIIVLGLVASNTPYLSKAQATNVTGILFSNTTWTKANSPYSLIGLVAVNQGVTLTIEAGVVINLNGNYIQVNGTLIAKGSNSDNIQFNSGTLVFTPLSNSWNEQTQSGSVLENCIFGPLTVNSSSPRLNNNTINGDIQALGARTITNSLTITNCKVNASISTTFCSLALTNNSFTYTGSLDVNTYDTCIIQSNTFPGMIKVGDFSVVRNNHGVTGIDARGFGSLISDNVISNGWIAAGNSSIVTNNTVIGGIRGQTDYSSKGSVTISNNTVVGTIDSGGLLATITNNRVRGEHASSSIGLAGNILIGNTISDFTTDAVATGGNATIIGNLFFNNSCAVSVNAAAILQNNTFSNNSIAIKLQSTSASIAYNNFQNNKENIHLGVSTNFNAAYNWWGTTNQTAIKESMYDYYQNFNLGNVTFLPLLSAPNPQAPDVNTVIPETFSSWIILALTLIVSLATAMLFSKNGRVNYSECHR